MQLISLCSLTDNNESTQLQYPLSFSSPLNHEDGKITQDNDFYATSVITTNIEDKEYETIGDRENEIITDNQGSTSHSENTTSHLPVPSYVNHSTVHLSVPSNHHQDQAVPTTDVIPTVTNECYSTSRLPSPTRPRGRMHRQQDMQLTQNQDVLTTDNIPTVTRLPSPTRLRVHQQQDMQLTQNQDVLNADNIQTVTNECYSTSRLPSPTHPRGRMH